MGDKFHVTIEPLIHKKMYSIFLIDIQDLILYFFLHSVPCFVITFHEFYFRVNRVVVLTCLCAYH